MEREQQKEVFKQALLYDEIIVREKAWYRLILDILTNNPDKFFDFSEISTIMGDEKNLKKEFFNVFLLVVLQHPEIHQERFTPFIYELIRFKEEDFAEQIILRLAEEHDSYILQYALLQIIEASGSYDKISKLLNLYQQSPKDVWLEQILLMIRNKKKFSGQEIQKIFKIALQRKGDFISISLVNSLIENTYISDKNLLNEILSGLQRISKFLSNNDMNNLLRKIFSELLCQRSNEIYLELLRKRDAPLQKEEHIQMALEMAFCEQLFSSNPDVDFAYQLALLALDNNIWILSEFSFNFFVRHNRADKLFEIWMLSRDKGIFENTDNPEYIGVLTTALREKEVKNIKPIWSYILEKIPTSSPLWENLLSAVYSQKKYIFDIFDPMANKFHRCFRQSSWQTLSLLNINNLNWGETILQMVSYLFLSHFYARSPQDIEQICQLSLQIGLKYKEQLERQKLLEQISDILYWGTQNGWQTPSKEENIIIMESSQENLKKYLELQDFLKDVIC